MFTVTTAEFTAKGTANILVNRFIPLWGCPSTLLSDNGPQLCARLATIMYKLLGIQHYGTNVSHGLQRTPKYAPAAQKPPPTANLATFVVPAAQQPPPTADLATYVAPTAQQPPASANPATLSSPLQRSLWPQHFRGLHRPRCDTASGNNRSEDCYVYTEDCYSYTEDYYIYTEDCYVYTEDCYAYTEDCYIYTEDYYVYSEDCYVYTPLRHCVAVASKRTRH